MGRIGNLDLLLIYLSELVHLEHREIKDTEEGGWDLHSGSSCVIICWSYCFIWIYLCSIWWRR